MNFTCCPTSMCPLLTFSRFMFRKYGCLQIIEQEKEHGIYQWKSSSWLVTGTEMLRGLTG